MFIIYVSFFLFDIEFVFMQPFLKTVAVNYYKRYSDLSNFTFIFPNKRSGTFFLKYLRDCCEQPSVAPLVKTISEFVEDVTETPVDNNIDLLFKLFVAYRDLVGETADFERFRSFGETALSDFNEVDMQMVDVEALFKNIKDLNEIKSNYITPQQRKVMREYFNYPDYENIRVQEEKFWKNFEDFRYSEEKGQLEAKAEKTLGNKFIHLWSLLFPLYSKFKKILKTDGVNTSGGSYRDCVAKLENMEEDNPFFLNKKYVFVGFNALTESERRIFKAIKSHKFMIEGRTEDAADFIWDLANRFFRDVENPASKYVLLNSRKDAFPAPEWWKENEENLIDNSYPQDIKVISVPSNIMQIKIIKEKIEELFDNINEDKFKEAKVAVILPDESYLLPLINSLPNIKSGINLTMGYPLKYTPVMSFIHHLKKLQLKKRPDKTNGAYFFFEDVKKFLLHPFCQLIFKTNKIKDLINDFGKKRKLVISYTELCEKLPACREIFFPLNSDATHRRTIDYLRNALKMVENHLEIMAADNDSQPTLDIFFIEKALDALQQVENSLNDYGMSMNFVSLFSVLDKMIATVTAPFEGEPLGGLQVMGLLETRNLDFEYIFMPGLNDKVLPKTGFSRTFIPNVVRMAYGMPPSNFQENLFAYYFYRLLARSREAMLSYDSRATDNRRGSVSRYVLQLKYLFPSLFIDNPLKEEEAKFLMEESEDVVLEIPKDERVAEVLTTFRYEKGECPRHFSSTSVSQYCKCPILFLYSYIQKQKVDKEPEEAIDAAGMGSIIHEAIMNLYLPDATERKVLLKEPKEVTEKYIKDILEDEKRIELELKKSINRHHYNLRSEQDKETHEIEGSALLIFPNLKRQLLDILNYDLKLAPFKIYGCEFEDVVDVEIDKGLKISMKLIIDRLDFFEETETMRIVDYKTGSVNLTADDFKNVFDGSYRAKNILQLLLYAYLLNLMKESAEKKLAGYRKRNTEPLNNVELKDKEKCEIIASLPLQNLKTEIYNVPKLITPKYEPNLPKIQSAEKPEIEVFDDETSKWFVEGLREKIREIFNLEIPFVQTSSSRNCEWCDFKILCDIARFPKSQ